MLSKLFKVRVRSKDYQGRTWIIRRRFGNRTVGSRRRSSETEEGGHLHRSVLSNPNILNMYEVLQKWQDIIKFYTFCPRVFTNIQFSAKTDTKRRPMSRLLTADSGGGEEENLSNYFEPYGLALVPCAPRQHHQLRIWQSPDQREGGGLWLWPTKRWTFDRKKEISFKYYFLSFFYNHGDLKFQQRKFNQVSGWI